MISDVIEAKQYCIDNGIPITGPCGAFNITARVAYKLRADGWGLIHKNPGQNGCSHDSERYAVDAIMLHNGSVIDLLINSETENIPAWQSVGSADVDLWRSPINLDSDVPVPIPEPIPIPPVPEKCECKSELDSLKKTLDVVLLQVQAINAKEPPVYVGTLFGYRITLVPVK